MVKIRDNHEQHSQHIRIYSWTGVGVIGAVAGATLTSITNLVANFGNNKRLSLQLAHDAKEKILTG